MDALSFFRDVDSPTDRGPYVVEISIIEMPAGMMARLTLKQKIE